MSKSGHVLHTGRLILRDWRDSDREAFAAMSADPDVMEDFGGPLNRTESDAKFDRYASAFEQHGFCRSRTTQVPVAAFKPTVTLCAIRLLRRPISSLICAEIHEGGAKWRHSLPGDASAERSGSNPKKGQSPCAPVGAGIANTCPRAMRRSTRYSKPRPSKSPARSANTSAGQIAAMSCAGVFAPDAGRHCSASRYPGRT